MAFPRPEIEITLRADRLIQGTQRARGEFNNLKQTATSTFTDMQSRSGQAEAAMNRLATSTQRSTGAVKGLALSMVGLGTTTIGVITSMSNLDRAAARVEKTGIAVRRVEDQIASTRALLNRMTATGKTNTEQYAVQVSRLSTALADLEVKQLDVKLAIDANNDAQILFATMVANTVINSLFLITNLDITQKLFGKLTIRTATQTGALIVYNKVQLLSIVGMKALRAAAIAFMLTPLGIVLLSLSAGFLAFEANLFGVRTELEKLTGVQKDGLSVFTLMGQVMSDGQKKTDELAGATSTASTAFSPGLTGAVGAANTSFGSLSTTLGSGGGTLGGGSGVIGQIKQLNIALTEGQALLLKQKELTEQGKLGFAALLGVEAVDTLPQFLREPLTIVEENFELMKKGAVIQQERGRIQKQFNLLGEVELNRGKVLRLVLKEINETLKAKLTSGRISIQQYEEELRLTRLIAINVFRTRKEHEKITDEQKKSLQPLSDLLESLKGTVLTNPLFGFNGVFSSGAGARFGQTPSDRFTGFHGGIGSSITVGGKTFQSRKLNPNFGKIFGGGADAAILNFIRNSGGFSTAIAGNAISEGILRAVSSFVNTRILQKDDAPFETTGFDFRFTPLGGDPASGRSGVNNFANPNFAQGRPSPGSVTPFHIIARGKAQDALAKRMIMVFGLTGAGPIFEFADILQPEAAQRLRVGVQGILSLINTVRNSRVPALRTALGRIIRDAVELDRTIRRGFITGFGRGESLSSFANFFGQRESIIFDGIRSKFDVVDLEARMFFSKREQLAMIG